MHDCVALDPLSISLGVAKRSEADGAGNLSRLAKQPRSSSLYWLEATQRSVVGVQGLSRRRRLHPCHVANAGVGSAHGVDKPLGGRVVGGRCAKGTHFRGYGFIATSDFGTKCSEYTDSCGMVSLASYAAYCHLAAVILDNLQMLVQCLSVALG